MEDILGIVKVVKREMEVKNGGRKDRERKLQNKCIE